MLIVLEACHVAAEVVSLRDIPEPHALPRSLFRKGVWHFDRVTQGFALKERW